MMAFIPDNKHKNHKKLIIDNFLIIGRGINWYGHDIYITYGSQRRNQKSLAKDRAEVKRKSEEARLQAELEKDRQKFGWYARFRIILYLKTGAFEQGNGRKKEWRRI